jgi:hypothetical protein
MSSKRIHELRASRKPAGGFLREAGRAGIVLLALAGPVNNYAKAEETVKQDATPPAQEVGRYPNFSGAGVHGNPAVWPEYGNWGYAEFSGDPAQENASLSAMLSSRLVGNVHGVLKLSAGGDTHSTTTSAQGILALTLPFTLRAGIGIGVDSAGKESAQVGIASVVARGRLLLRNGVDYDLPTGQIRAASEIRRSFGRMELTGSGNASFTVKDGTTGYAGQSAGVQLFYRGNLVSFGCGGVKIGEWDRFRLHYRIWAARVTAVDIHLRGKGEGMFRNPDYVGVGITQMF